jgi:hypothetical protein
MSVSSRRAAIDWLRRQMPAEASLPRHLAAAGVTIAQYMAARSSARPSPPRLSADAAGWLRCVQQDGYCTVPDFYDRQTCRNAVAELERLFSQYPDFVQRKSDRRMFGVEAASPLLRQFACEPNLLALAGAVLQAPTVNAFTLGARIDYSPNNAGSGEGWHRDSFVVQFKAIVYLCDVEADTGPFELIADSEKLAQLASDIVRGRLGLLQNRVADAQVQRLLAAEPERLRTFTAKAGTLLLANTSAIHRGKPIEDGTRYALTNYYVQTRQAGPAMDAHFAPVLRSA